MYDNNLYVGSTDDLRRRLAEHNVGKSQATKVRLPLVLRYYEAYANEEDARHREYALKHNGRVWTQLKRHISASLQ
jgi:putative endonuclease